MSRSAAEKIAALQGVLTRVQTNARGPRERHVALAHSPLTPSPADELEVVDDELDEADELPASSQDSAPAVLAKVALVAQVPEPAPTVGAIADDELIEELAEEDEVAPAAELELVTDEPVAPSAEPPVADAPIAPPPVSEPLPISAPHPISEPPLAAAEAAERAKSSAPPPAPAGPPPRTERRSASIELAIQAAAAAGPIAMSDSLEADVPQREDAPPDRPSDAQLGAIIELEEATAAAIELAPSAPVAPPQMHEEEQVLPAAQSPGQFARGLVPSEAPTASVADVALAIPPSPPAPPSAAPRPAPAHVTVSVEASAVLRTELRGDVAEFVAAARKPAPTTFGELLDDALSLLTDRGDAALGSARRQQISSTRSIPLRDTTTRSRRQGPPSSPRWRR